MRVFETERLYIRRAEPVPADIDLFCSLWNNPEVMHWVGFPEGLGMPPDGMEKVLSENSEDPLNAKLVVVRRADGVPIGECKLGTPDDNGVCETDVKLLPPFQGGGYGTELKRGLINYLFTRTKCTTVRATPNRENVASQKMQERVGAKRVGQGVFRFKEPMGVPTCEVPYYVYEIKREEWANRQGS